MKSRMKSALNNLNEEGGSVFPMVLVLFLLGALLIPPLLGMVSTGIVSGSMYQAKSQELYAADAGAMDALWVLAGHTPEEMEALIQSDDDGDSEKYIYDLPDPVNNKTVQYEITIADADADIYVIKSTATGPDGSSSTVEVWAKHPVQPEPIFYGVAALDGDMNLNSAELGSADERVNIYANGNIDIAGGSQVWGDAYRTNPHEVTVGNNSELHGEKILTPLLDICDDFTPEDPYDPGDINTHYTLYTGNMNINSDQADFGPIHITGDLQITGGIVELTGTVWVEGKIKITGGAIFGYDTSEISEEYPEGKPYFIVSQDYDLHGNAFSVSGSPPAGYEYMIQAILYAPNGSIYVSGDSALEGSAMGKVVDIKGSSKINNDLQLKTTPIVDYPMEILAWKIY